MLKYVFLLFKTLVVGGLTFLNPVLVTPLTQEYKFLLFRLGEGCLLIINYDMLLLIK